MNQKEQEYNQRKYISEIAKKGAQIKVLGKMCSTCAFKFNSEANLEPHNVESAFMSIGYDNQVFNCHEQIGVDKGCVCVGYLHAKQYYDNRFKD
jgi:hypothetical protein